jgi:hypothetical protein
LVENATDLSKWVGQVRHFFCIGSQQMVMDRGITTPVSQVKSPADEFILASADHLPEDAKAWILKADELALWSSIRLLHRNDAYGKYRPLEEVGRAYRRKDGTKGKLGEQTTVKAKVNLNLLASHFRATDRAHILGLHSANAENMSKAGALDIDYHGPKSTSPEINSKAALGWYAELTANNFHPLLTTSNGIGGFHLRILLAEPIPADHMYWFLKYLTRNHREFGLSERPEQFPKQEDVRLCKMKFGNWLRCPGKHHKKDHWSNVFDGKKWLKGNDAIDFILGLKGDPPSLIPDAIESRIRLYMATLPNLNEGQGRDDVAYNFLAFMVRDLKLADDYALDWANRWDTGNRPPKGPQRLREILANVHSYGQRPYGAGLNGSGSGNGCQSVSMPSDDEDPIHHTDRGNAIRLVGQHRNEIRYVGDWKKWLVYENGRWNIDGAATVVLFAKKMLVGLYRWAIGKEQELEPSSVEVDNDNQE